MGSDIARYQTQSFAECLVISQDTTETIRSTESTGNIVGGAGRICERVASDPQSASVEDTLVSLAIDAEYCWSILSNDILTTEEIANELASHMSTLKLTWRPLTVAEEVIDEDIEKSDPSALANLQPTVEIAIRALLLAEFFDMYTDGTKPYNEWKQTLLNLRTECKDRLRTGAQGASGLERTLLSFQAVPLVSLVTNELSGETNLIRAEALPGLVGVQGLRDRLREPVERHGNVNTRWVSGLENLYC